MKMLRTYKDEVYSDLTYFTLSPEYADILVRDERPSDFFSAIDKVTRHRKASHTYKTKDYLFTMIVSECKCDDPDVPLFNIIAWEDVTPQRSREQFNMGSTFSIIKSPGVEFVYGETELNTGIETVYNTIKKIYKERNWNNELVTSFDDLKEGHKYALFNKQFGVTNNVWIVSEDFTGLSRKIVYYQYAERGRKRILKSAMIAMFAADKDPDVMAMWHTDFKDYIIHQIK